MSMEELTEEIMATPDPMGIKDLLWPHVTFYKQQKQIIYSVWDDDETVCTAGNMLGKDFVAGFIALAFFLSRHPCRIVTTSAKDQHLDVLWSEVNWFIRESRVPLGHKDGGPLVINHQHLRKIYKDQMCPTSYVTSMVAKQDSIASMQGHHVKATGDNIPRTLFMCDESSSVMDDYYRMASTWMNRAYIFGNPWPCNNFFYRAVKGNPKTKDPGGDKPRRNGEGYHRRVIRIRAEDSPNVRLGLAQERRGKMPTNEMLVQGVKPYNRYLQERESWDEHQLCVSHGGDFYEGSEIKLYPAEHRKLAHEVARELVRRHGPKRRGKTLGIDPGEGSANTTWTVADDLGLIKQIQRKTKDTSKIIDITVDIAREFGVKADNILFDRGGGGKQLADVMRSLGYPVRTVGFGEAVTPDKRRGLTPLETRKLQDEERFSYVNRRAEMYGLLSRAIDPGEGAVYGIPEEMSDLVDQLKVIPKLYENGKLWLPPKHKTNKTENSNMKTMTELVGHSPDEADSAVLAYYGIIHKSTRAKARVLRRA
jgi:hypothetical protein